MDSSDNINTSGMSVPVRFSAGLIVLSFFVSFVGAFSTVELLHRRENYKGWIKWYVAHLPDDSQLGPSLT